MSDHDMKQLRNLGIIAHIEHRAVVANRLKTVVG